MLNPAFEIVSSEKRGIHTNRWSAFRAYISFTSIFWTPRPDPFPSLPSPPSIVRPAPLEDPLALPYALAIERFCSRGSGADLYHLKSEEPSRSPRQWRVGYVWWFNSWFRFYMVISISISFFQSWIIYINMVNTWLRTFMFYIWFIYCFPTQQLSFHHRVAWIGRSGSCRTPVLWRSRRRWARGVAGGLLEINGKCDLNYNNQCKHRSKSYKHIYTYRCVYYIYIYIYNIHIFCMCVYIYIYMYIRYVCVYIYIYTDITMNEHRHI